MEYLTLEVALSEKTNLSDSELTMVIENYIIRTNVRPGTILDKFEDNSLLMNNVEYIVVGEANDFTNLPIDSAQVPFKCFFYTLNKDGPQQESMEKDDEQLEIGTFYTLPSAEFFQLWETLIFENGLKENLLRFLSNIVMYAYDGVNSNIISCNRILLLYGPPGTGKTSLCKALAQKLAVQLHQRFHTIILFEINSHNLFSKWFSESGKQVTRVFHKVRDYLANSKILVCILIDEIESLVHSRQASFTGNEPSDSVRVVNAILTEIDKMKRYPNLIIFATSNMTNAIDLAFVDRADIKQYIGLPEVHAIYRIYHSCIMEYMRVGIIFPVAVIAPHYSEEDANDACAKLFKIAQLSVGLSGRVLRKMPLIAHTRFAPRYVISIDDYFEALMCAVEYFKEERNGFSV